MSKQNQTSGVAHVVVMNSPGHLGGECTHCGAKLLLALPQTIRVVVAAINAFVAEHARCPKPTEGGQS